MEIKKISEVLTVFKRNKYQAYLVGGSSRDFMYSREFNDVDIATNAPLSFITEKFNVVNTDGKAFGSVKINYKNTIMEITKFRTEEYNEKSTFPKVKEFIDDPFTDAKRRDFTINAIYLDLSDMNKLQVIDPFDGIKDLFSYKLKFIGDPYLRIKEDPTRIIRALRIANKMNFTLEENTLKAIKENINELNRISSSKLNKEITIMANDLGEEKTDRILAEFGIQRSDSNETK